MLRLMTFLTALMMASAAAATSLFVHAPNDGFLNLRTGPSTGYHVLSEMPHGAKVKVLATPGKWYKVRDSYGTVGWAHSKYLSKYPVHKPEPTYDVLYVHAPGYSGLNLRTGPGKGYHKILTMHQGSKVKVLGAQGKWRLVKHLSTGQVGWAHNAFLAIQPHHAKPHQPNYGGYSWQQIVKKCSHRPAHKYQSCIARHLGWS